jgi:hypothetical protein
VRGCCCRRILTNFRGLFCALCLSRRHRFTYSDAAECYFKSTACTGANTKQQDR